MSRMIEIPYTPRYPDVHRQLESHRFSVIVAHRRFGKTVLSINHLIKQALLCKRERGSFAYVAPQRNQAKVISWAYLKHYSAPIPGRAVNEAELSIKFPNGAVIRVFGADNPDNLRGLYFDGVILDEVAQMRPEVWGEIVQPALADRQGWVLFIGTPKGINLFYDIYYGALESIKKGNRDWCAMSFPVTETNALPEKEVARLKEEMSENAYRQEMLCDFTASSDDILISIDDVQAAEHRACKLEDMKDWPMVVGVDVARFGDDATVFFARRGQYAYDEPEVYHHLDNVDVAHKLIEYIAVKKPEYVFIDQGQGTGVIDLVRRLTEGHAVKVVEIPFGSKAADDKKFANKRSEMWVKMRDWIIAGGKLPNNRFLEAELTAPTYSLDHGGRFVLEKKEEIKKRISRSTDYADALALTFAVDLPPSTLGLQREYDQYGVRVKGKMADILTGNEHHADEGDIFGYKPEIERGRDDWY